MSRAFHFLLGTILLAPLPALALGKGETTPSCTSCAEWNAPHAPFKIYGDTWYVGVDGLSSILITSDKGDILIDGDLNESAPAIAGHIKALGFKLSDIKLILNSHAHYDHSGGLSQLQHLTGAEVMASPWSAQLLKSGQDPKDDPQYGVLKPIAKVANVHPLHDGQTVHVGPLALTAHFTPGHTPGGTSWSWQSCDKGKCLNMVYADSQTAVSADSYRFTDHPGLLKGFDKSYAVFVSLPCDVLLTPHPDFSPILHPMLQGASLSPDPQACRKFADNARDGVQERVAKEKAGK